MARKKKKSAEQVAKEMQYLRRRNAGFIGERYPHVKRIYFNFTFEDFDEMVKPSHKKLSWGPEQYAFFEFDCPYYECVQGGFDLDDKVHAMLSNKHPEISGDLRCQGWQDRERIGQHHCYCKLTYRISAEYK